VSVATIYRAIESGQLDALRLGTAVQVPGWAVLAYTEACGQAYVAETAARVSHWGLTSEQADGLACVVCGADFLIAGAPRRPVGHSWNGSQVFACTDHDTHDEPGVGVAR
jgi:hypothetical protein